MFDSVLIANRGEIACRVIRTCRRLGIRTIAVYSEADAQALHVRMADEAWPIGGPRPQDSYLRGDAILEVARARGAQAIHPGYGFLSENADFAEAVEAAGIRFIGPSAASMRKMGSKAGAKDLMDAAGVPVVPGYTGEDQDAEALAREAQRIGFPLMIKAAHGGGGKGMRIVRAADEFAAALESCQREAANAFGRDRVLLERYIEQPRHIEIQVFGDGHGNTIHLFERECSAQRRYQKVLEESPSPFLTGELRTRMGEAAVHAARAIDYTNAGTVEFIVDPAGAFYFMEINTRLQVEHPVTELVTGLDLVEWQLRVAADEPLPLAQHAVTQQGHAIEVRLYAEDPDAGFLPGSGALTRLRLPREDAHVRVDSGVVEGDTVTIFYDPMIAKLIVHDADRPRALARLREALAACEIEGPKSNVGFLERLVRDQAVVEATIDTGYLDRQPDALRQAEDPQAVAMQRVAAVVAELFALEEAAHATPGDPHSPWSAGDGWHGAGAAATRLRLRDGEGVLDVHASGRHGRWLVTLGDAAPSAVTAARRDGEWLWLQVDGSARRYRIGGDRDHVLVHDGDSRRAVQFMRREQRAAGSAAGNDSRLRAPMPGRIVVVRAAAGDTVSAGQELLVMEAMKMEISIKAPRDGELAELPVAEGEFVEADTTLARLA
ncbi:acetyl/propionyl/methylcrotonyl-CoA carboxylase subunit alpha [Luteimonas yindakuii]|uniref:acetyl/propionyl/methylcrotonyl-CoA carboxylase subunit alpha n=1 Tax=Luteimonas yindakuii TaxID=2565782 RepID=UPI0011077847|nr:acetyl/propionyl/methylcrotonyl-CoA carboxylase subunit alpha [Luteimonas yindakuii]QCU72521.1 acetyl/propionyl/methylcrotonyl-CoA carboxylase subunit alpha [Luteimonas yindakuii]